MQIFSDKDKIVDNKPIEKHSEVIEEQMEFQGSTFVKIQDDSKIDPKMDDKINVSNYSSSVDQEDFIQKYKMTQQNYLEELDQFQNGKKD